MVITTESFKDNMHPTVLFYSLDLSSFNFCHYSLLRLYKQATLVTSEEHFPGKFKVEFTF